MRNKLILLITYLSNNGYEDDAKRVQDILDEICINNSGTAKKRLIAMCNPRYLGNYNIVEFDSAYNWWNFLGEISEEVKKNSDII